ncbi:ribonuclease P protein component [Thermaerobacter litoralis]
MSLPRPLRLQRGDAFRQVRREGRSWANRWVVLFAWRPGGQADAEPARVGITVGRRLGKAVRRNRVRRVLAEAYRHLAPRVAGGWWLVVVAREASAGIDYPTAVRALEDVLRKARILRPPSPGGLHDAGDPRPFPEGGPPGGSPGARPVIAGRPAGGVLAPDRPVRGRGGGAHAPSRREAGDGAEPGGRERC